MLKINFEAETENDAIDPINIASALIAYKFITVDDLYEIEGHLREYTSRCRRVESRKRHRYNDEEF